jgi:peptidyl-tRNA hydrolase, PTH1 family
VKNPFKRSNKRRFPADWMVVGLGNPGREYAGTRHNVGFWVVNRLAKRSKVSMKRAGSMMQFAGGELAGTRIALVKPLTYVNRSGKAIGQAAQWTGCDAQHTIVVYDELDMEQGALRVRSGGGHGGHNGLKSIGAAIGLDFIRIRIGIGRPRADGEPSWEPAVVAAHVLGDPGQAERQVLDETVALAMQAIETVITEGADIAGTKFNRKQPPAGNEPARKPGAGERRTSAKDR